MVCILHSALQTALQDDPKAKISDELPQQAQKSTPSPLQFQDFFISELFEGHKKDGTCKACAFAAVQEKQDELIVLSLVEAHQGQSFLLISMAFTPGP